MSPFGKNILFRPDPLQQLKIKKIRKPEKKVKKETQI